jgi:hypothetical protein
MLTGQPKSRLACMLFTAKAEAKLERALEYLATLNTTATAKPDKWVVNASILASLTGCYRPAINTFIEARKQQIDQLNATHGLGPGQNRAKAKPIFYSGRHSFLGRSSPGAAWRAIEVRLSQKCSAISLA